MGVPENLRNLDVGLIVTPERSQKTPHSGDTARLREARGALGDTAAQSIFPAFRQLFAAPPPWPARASEPPHQGSSPMSDAERRRRWPGPQSRDPPSLHESPSVAPTRVRRSGPVQD